MNDPSNNHPKDDRNSDCQPGVSIITTTTIRNATCIYYTVTNALSAPSNALWSAFCPRRLFSIGLASSVGQFWPFCSAVPFNTKRTAPHLLITTGLEEYAHLPWSCVWHPQPSTWYRRSCPFSNQQGVLQSPCTRPSHKRWDERVPQIRKHTIQLSRIQWCSSLLSDSHSLSSRSAQSMVVNLYAGLFKTVSKATPPSRASKMPFPILTQQDSLYLKIPLPIGPSWRPHLQHQTFCCQSNASPMLKNSRSARLLTQSLNHLFPPKKSSLRQFKIGKESAGTKACCRTKGIACWWPMTNSTSAVAFAFSSILTLMSSATTTLWFTSAMVLTKPTVVWKAQLSLSENPSVRASCAEAVSTRRETIGIQKKDDRRTGRIKLIPPVQQIGSISLTSRRTSVDAKFLLRHRERREQLNSWGKNW